MPWSLKHCCQYMDTVLIHWFSITDGHLNHTHTHTHSSPTNASCERDGSIHILHLCPGQHVLVSQWVPCKRAHVLQLVRGFLNSFRGRNSKNHVAWSGTPEQQWSQKLLHLVNFHRTSEQV